jgi:hypothetical protein
MKFRKRPIEFEAVQFNGSNTAEICDLAGEGNKIIKADIGSAYQLVIRTRYGDCLVYFTDWVVRDMFGDIQVVRSSVFNKTYELVTDETK